MIDAVCKCSICGKPPSANCDCHKPKDPVTLKCTECPATLVVEREPDFLDFKEIETICPDCAKDPKKKEAHERRTRATNKKRR